MLKTTLLVGLLGNPEDIARVLSLLQVGRSYLFGPDGASLIDLTGSAAWAAAIGLVALAAWIVLPVLAAIRIFQRQNL